MKVREVAAWIESFAPLSLQEAYDNCGLNLGDPNGEVSGMLLCVDVTEAVLDEAIALGANLIVSHHPLLFHPLREVVDADATQRMVRKALCAGISLYAAHTSLDSAPQGMSFRLGCVLELEALEVLVPREDMPGSGLGVVGNLSGGPRTITRYLEQIKDKLGCGAIRHSALSLKRVTRVALVTGSGASFIEHAVTAGADLYVTADLKYNDFYVPDGRLVVADVGHFESEYCAIELLYDIITKKIATFAIHKSVHSVNPVNYFV